MPGSLPEIKITVSLSYDTKEGASSITVSLFDKSGDPVSGGFFPETKKFSKTPNQLYKILGISAVLELQHKYPAKSLLKEAATYVKQAYDESACVIEFDFSGPSEWPPNALGWFKKCLLPGNPYSESEEEGNIFYHSNLIDELAKCEDIKKDEKAEASGSTEEPTEEEPAEKVEGAPSPATHVYVSPRTKTGDGGYKSALMRAWKYQGSGMILSLDPARASLIPNIGVYGVLSDDMLSAARKDAQKDIELNASTYVGLDPSDSTVAPKYDKQLADIDIINGTKFIIGEKSLGPSSLGLCTAVIYGGPADGMKIVAAQCDLIPITELDKRILTVDSMPGDPKIMFPDWRKRDPCQPFKNESLPYGSEYWITVETDYENASLDMMNVRLKEATVEGIEKLLDFYNKTWWAPEPNIASEAENAYNAGFARRPNVVGRTAIWETLSEGPAIQGFGWRSWHFTPGAVNSRGESVGSKFRVLVRVPEAYLEAMPDKVDAFDYDKCGFTRSITFEAKALSEDISSAARIMKSKGAAAKFSTNYTTEPRIDLEKEAERLENFVEQGLKGLLQSNGLPTSIFTRAGTESIGTEYMIEIGFDDEYGIKFVVVADKSKMDIPSGKLAKVKAIGDYKGATPLMRGLSCVIEKYSSTTIAYFYYHRNMIGKGGAKALESGNWTDFITAFTYPVPLITKKGGEEKSAAAAAEEVSGETIALQNQASVFEKLAPHLRTKDEAEYENIKVADPKKKKRLEHRLATIEKVGNFRSSTYLHDAFTNKVPGLHAKIEYSQEVDFVYKQVINNAGVATLAAKIAHCLMVEMTLNEILEMLCRKAMDELDYDALKEVLLHSPWAAAMQQVAAEVTEKTGYAGTANEKLAGEAKAAKTKYSSAQDTLQAAQETYKSYPSPDNLKFLCATETSYGDALAEVNITMGAQFFGTVPLAGAGKKIEEYKDVLMDVVGNLPDYVCRDIIGKLTGSIKFIDNLMSVDWEIVFDGLPDKLTFEIPRLMVPDLIATIKTALKEALLKVVVKILVELFKKILEEILDLCMGLRQVAGPSSGDRGGARGKGKADLAEELVQPHMVAKAMDMFDGKSCGELSESEMMSAMFDMFEDLSLILTATELCALLDGAAYPGTVDMIFNLIAKRYQSLTGCFPTREKVEDLFKILGSFIDSDICVNLAAQEEKIRESAGGTYDGACPPEFQEALESGCIDEELCNEQLENMKKDRVNKLAELAKLMDRDPDQSATLPLPLCGATPPPGAEKINYSKLVNPYEFEPVQYMVAEVLGAMFVGPRKAFNSDLSNFLPAVTFFDVLGHGSDGAQMGASMFSKVNTLDVKDKGSVDSLMAEALKEMAKNAAKGVAPSLRRSLEKRSNFISIASQYNGGVWFTGLKETINLPMLDEVPLSNVYRLSAVREYSSDDQLLGVQLYCAYPRFGLAGNRKDPYVIFITAADGTLLFADVGDGNTSLYTERPFVHSGGILLSDAGLTSTVDPFEDPYKSVVKLHMNAAGEQTEKEQVELVQAYIDSGGTDKEMAALYTGNYSPQSAKFAEIAYDSWKNYGIIDRYVESQLVDDTTEIGIKDVAEAFAMSFWSEFNSANQYILRKIASRIADSELFNKEEFQEFATALVLDVPCADDEPDVKTSLLDIPEILKKINEKMSRLACVEGSLDDSRNPPLKKAAMEGVVRLAVRLIVIELSLRGIFVFAKFKMGAIFKNNFFLKYIARETMQMVKQIFGHPYSIHFTRVVKDIFDDRKALNDVYINPFGPQEVDEDGNAPEIYEILTVQDAIGYMALEQVKFVSDQLGALIDDVFSEDPGWGLDPGAQFLNMLRYGPPEVDPTAEFGKLKVNPRPKGVNYVDIFRHSSSPPRFYKSTIKRIVVEGAAHEHPNILKINLEELKQQKLITPEQFSGIDIDAGQLVSLGGDEPLFVQLGEAVNPNWALATTELGADVFEGGFIIERYLKHHIFSVETPATAPEGSNLYGLQGPDSEPVQVYTGYPIELPATFWGGTPLNIEYWATWLANVLHEREPSFTKQPYRLVTGAKSLWKYGLRLCYVSPHKMGTSANLYNTFLDKGKETDPDVWHADHIADLRSKAFRVTEWTEIEEVGLFATKAAKQLESGAGDESFYVKGIVDKVPSHIYIHPMVEVEVEIPDATPVDKLTAEFANHEDKLFELMLENPKYRALTGQSINVSRFSSMMGMYSIFAFKNNKHMRALFHNTKSSLKTLFITLLEDDYKSDTTDRSGDSAVVGGGPTPAVGGSPVNLLSMAAMTPFHILRGIVELTDPGYMRYKSAAEKSSIGGTDVFESPKPPSEMGESGKKTGYKWDSGNSTKGPYDFDWNIFGSLNGGTAWSFPWTPAGWLLTFADYKRWDDLEEISKKKKPCPLPPAPPEKGDLKPVKDPEEISLGQYLATQKDPLLAPLEYGVVPCMSVGEKRDMVTNPDWICPDEGYTEPGSWPPRKPKAFEEEWAPAFWDGSTTTVAVPSEYLDEAKAMGNSLSNLSDVDQLGIWPSQAAEVPVMTEVKGSPLTVCHQLLLLKGYYEASIENTVKFGPATYVIGMVNRLMEVMDMSGKGSGGFNCAESEDPYIKARLTGGIGHFYKELSVQEIINYFSIKGTDFEGYMPFMTIGHTLGEGSSADRYIYDNLEGVKPGNPLYLLPPVRKSIVKLDGLVQGECVPCLNHKRPAGDTMVGICPDLEWLWLKEKFATGSTDLLNWRDVELHSDAEDYMDLLGSVDDPLNPHAAALEVIIAAIEQDISLGESITQGPDEYKDGITLFEFPPHEPIKLYGLWKYYNNLLKQLMTNGDGQAINSKLDDDLYGLMKGRGFLYARSKRVEGGVSSAWGEEITTEHGVASYRAGLKIVEWPEYVEHWPANSGAIKSIFRTHWKEDKHNLGSSGDQHSIDHILRIFSDPNFLWTEFIFIEDVGEGITTMEELLDITIPEGAWENMFEENIKEIMANVPQSIRSEQTEAAAGARAYETSGPFRVPTALIRAAIKNLWEVEMRMSQIGYGPFAGKDGSLYNLSKEQYIATYGTTSPIMCLNEDYDFFKKYFENPDTGQRAESRIAQIAQFLQVVPASWTDQGGTATYEKGNYAAGVNPDNNWIIANSLFGYDAEKLIEANLDHYHVPSAGETYPDNVYGPDEHGYFWIHYEDEAGYRAWPEEGHPGHKPYQPSFLSVNL